MYISEKTGALSSSVSKFINIVASFVLVASTTLFGLALNAVEVNAAGTEIITASTTGVENDPGKWLFNRDLTTLTPYQFDLNEKQIGDGSLHVLPIGDTNPKDKFIAEYFALEEIANINSFSYDFKVGAGGDEVSDANEFYLNVYANFGESDPLKYYDCKYDVVLTNSSGWTTNPFDPTQSYPVTKLEGKSWAPDSPYDCPDVPADMDNYSANSTIRMFALNLGDTTLNDEGLDGYFDNVIFSTDSSTHTYDFEPARLEAPELLSPADGSVENNESGVFQDWTNVNDATEYVYESYSDEAITDLSYTTVRNVSNRTVGATAGENTFFWRVAAVDSIGVIGEWSEVFELTLDVSDPDVDITSHSNGDVVSGVVEVKGSYTDENPDWRRLIIRNLSDSSLELNSGRVDVTASFTDETLETWDSTAVEDGDYRLKLRGADLAGNKADDAVNISVDNPPAMPTGVTIRQGHDTSAPIIGCSALTNNGMITIDWDDNSEADINHYWLGIDNASRTNPYHKKVNNSYYFANVTPGNAPYNYTVIAVDDAGNESEMATCGEFELDIENPVAELTNLTDGQYVSGTVAINGTVTDDNPWRYYSVVTNDGTNTKVAGPGTVYESNSFTDQLLFNWNTNGVADGPYDVRLAARDLVNNRGPESEDMINVNVDNTAPVLTVDTPAAETAYSGIFTVEGTAIDAGVGTDSVNVMIKDSSDADVFNTDAVYDSLDDTWSLDVDTELEALGDGEYTFVFTAIDTLGNESEVSVMEVTFDNTAPTSSFSPTTSVDEPSPELNGTTDDEDATIEVTVNGETLSATNNGDGTWTLASGTLSPLADGSYDVTVESTDALGNSDNTTFPNSLTIESTPEETGPTGGDTSFSPSTESNPDELPDDGIVAGAQSIASTTSVEDTDDGSDENTDNGEVLQATDNTTDEETNANDEESNSDCAKIIGICWYYWIIPIVLGIVGYNFYASRKEQ